jgi:hypothetical protein
MKKNLSYDNIDSLVPDLERELEVKKREEKEKICLKNQEIQNRHLIEKKLFNLMINSDEKELINNILNLHEELNVRFQRIYIDRLNKDMIDAIGDFILDCEKCLDDYLKIESINTMQKSATKKRQVESFLSKTIIEPLRELKENLLTAIEAERIFQQSQENIAEKTPYQEKESLFERLKNFITNLILNFLELFKKKDERKVIEMDKVDMKVVNISSISCVNLEVCPKNKSIEKPHHIKNEHCVPSGSKNMKYLN